jgi:hypothetical protein
MILHEDSHTDHVPQEVLNWVLHRFQDREAFFIETVELPDGLPQLACGLHGPVMGDVPVPEEGVTYRARWGSSWVSRLVDRPFRLTRQITVIGGSYKTYSCVLYTCFGGPLSPKEPQDPTLAPKNREESLKFWSEHALSV